MRPTRHLWAAAALAALLAALAALFARPLLLGATALIGAWIVSRQYLFLRTVSDAVAGLDVSQAPAKTGVQTGGETPVTLAATVETPSPLQLSIEAGVPPGATRTEPLTLSLAPGATGARRTATVAWPIAGRHEFARPTLTVGDGLFETTVPVGPAPTVTVEPRGPRTVHVGAGGDRVAVAQGEHESGRYGPGVEAAGLREYVPGDRADRIDWKATARLDTLYVRERDAETDRPSVLCVDRRASLSTGSAGETKLDYLREVALALAASAEAAGDPLGLVTVADDGLPTAITPARGPTHYRTVRRRLLELDAEAPHHATAATPAGATAPAGSGARAAADGRSSPVRTHAGTRPRTALTQLDRDEDAFARALAPFYASRDRASTLEATPLQGAVRTATAHHRGRGWLVLCTDDADPTALRGAIRHARDQGQDVLALLTPTVLFEPGGLADLDAAYDRYLAFEELRRDLDRMHRVTALEVAPGDRLSTVLAGRTRRGDRR